MARPEAGRPGASADRQPVRRVGRIPGLIGLVALAAVAAALAWQWRGQVRLADSLLRRLASIQPLAPGQALPCATWHSQRPLVLLALGQSNAANHGTPAGAAAVPIQVLHAGQCAMAVDPLPGGTGEGASIWARLPAELALRGVQRPVVMAVLAVDATTIADWTDAAGPLPQRLATTLAANAAAGLRPDLVLWQQGESDARRGTSTADFQSGLRRLAAQLRGAGVDAPIALARSTVCRSAPDAGLHRAIDALVAADARFLPGPDTDAALPAAARPDGCHLDTNGVTVAARLWADLLAPRLIGAAGMHAPHPPAPVVTAGTLSPPASPVDNPGLGATPAPRACGREAPRADGPLSSRSA